MIPVPPRHPLTRAEFLGKKPVAHPLPDKIRLRVSGLKLRPNLMAAIKEKATLTPDGAHYEICPKEYARLNIAHGPGLDQNIGLADRVELGLCGKHREVWVAAKRPLRTPEQNAALKAICQECPALWRDMAGVNCRCHHCTTAGRWAATFNCPAQKWPAEMIQPPKTDAD